MKDAHPQAIFLKDYQVPDFLIDKTDLTFDLRADVTEVRSRLFIKRNPDANTQAALVLNGQQLRLVSLAIGDRLLGEDDYHCDENTLTITHVPDEFELSCTTHIDPDNNTSLEGLYRSSDMYCTQCEAEGFRKITYYLDRPDVMSEFTTTIIADRQAYPLLLSNGNPIERGEEGARHWVTWHDPFKKPAYLFALVAGDLHCIEDHFTTHSGRDITLQIFVEQKDVDKCGHAMTSLKNAMQWDEQVYGREYDLDIFMIVAVDDFNMGAMENKGLNIFNTSCVLAHPETTTDSGFQRVEGVVAHEYFHNWSGNRVTCRDWFQLSLKEGFTVFRDAEFSADMGSRTVKRVEDVTLLRTHQFAEDAGPMSHPVQPSSFIEIGNFYTLTVYEKGAEVVRMIHTLLGADDFRKGSDLYFERHDGQAVTINEFVCAMEAASGRDLTQFKYWYTQAGTPILSARDHYDVESETYSLTIEQFCPPTPEADEKEPFLIPVAIGLVTEAGCLPVRTPDDSNTETADNTTYTIELTKAVETFDFIGVKEKPVPSLLRDFSAPVRLNYNYSRADYLRLITNDSDGFARWDASQQLAVELIQEQMQAFKDNAPQAIDPVLEQALAAVLSDTSLDQAMVALMLELPSLAYLAEIESTIHVEAIYSARMALKTAIARALKESLWDIYTAYDHTQAYQPSAQAIAQRSLKNTALDYLMLLGEGDIHERCYQQFTNANNMTDSLMALLALVHSEDETLKPLQTQALAQFYERWQHEALVVNQWFLVQATKPSVNTLDTVIELMQHASFDIKNPNKVRSLIGAFCNQNMVGFHQLSGKGYDFLQAQIIQLDTLNPQIAARIITPLTRWKKYDEHRQPLMKQALETIIQQPNLSKDVYEVASKSLI